jgi:hypothetical protein
MTTMFDMNDAEPQQGGNLIPNGTFAKVMMKLRKGGIDGDGEVDKGLLRASKTPGSDVRMLDAEFTVLEGPHARRKFWQMFTVKGGKLDENGVSVGWLVSRSQFRAMIDSALGLDPKDQSEPAKAKRLLRGLADLDGITFVAKIKVEKNRTPGYADSNKLDYPVLPTAPEWAKVMNGEVITPNGGAPASSAPQWSAPAPAPTPAATTNGPAWAQPAGSAGQVAAAPAEGQAAAADEPAPFDGPAWLNG